MCDTQDHPHPSKCPAVPPGQEGKESNRQTPLRAPIKVAAAALQGLHGEAWWSTGAQEEAALASSPTRSLQKTMFFIPLFPIQSFQQRCNQFPILNICLLETPDAQAS